MRSKHCAHPRRSVLLLSDVFSEFFIQTFPNRCEFGSRKQHVPAEPRGARASPRAARPVRPRGSPRDRPLPARTGRSPEREPGAGSREPRRAGAGAGAGARRGAGGPGARQPSTMRPRRREPRAPPQQLCAASPAAPASPLGPLRTAAPRPAPAAAPPHRCRTGAARTCRTGCCSSRSRPPC